MNTIDTLQDILVRDYQVARALLTPDAPLSALGIDSLGFLELMFKIEDRFHVKIPGDMPTDLHTLQDVVRYIDALIDTRPAAHPHAVGAQALEP
ncbi:MAG TPA: acyl carrier protein [Steroidobacteraceae bacterium]|nr:acyl carrier protein [Steroidobacteraceae bacterium]